MCIKDRPDDAIRVPDHFLILTTDCSCSKLLKYVMSNQRDRESTDPSTYSTHHQRFEKAGLPTTQQAWIQRAKEVADILGEDAASRDIANKSPRAEVSLLKSSGLLKVLGPKKYGGGEQSWETGYKVIREGQSCLKYYSHQSRVVADSSSTSCKDGWQSGYASRISFAMVHHGQCSGNCRTAGLGAASHY